MSRWSVGTLVLTLALTGCAEIEVLPFPACEGTWSTRDADVGFDLPTTPVVFDGLTAEVDRQLGGHYASLLGEAYVLTFDPDLAWTSFEPSEEGCEPVPVHRGSGAVTLSHPARTITGEGTGAWIVQDDQRLETWDAELTLALDDVAESAIVGILDGQGVTAPAELAPQVTLTHYANRRAEYTITLDVGEAAPLELELGTLGEVSDVW
jgi:hypothetical protein